MSREYEAELEAELERMREAYRQHSSTIRTLRAEVRRLEGELDSDGNALLGNLHCSWVEVELAIEYRAGDIDCEGDGDGEGTDTDPLECQHCRLRAKAETDAFMAISKTLEAAILTTRSILGIDDPKYLPVRPVKASLDKDIRWEWREDAYDSVMAMVPTGRFGTYDPEAYAQWEEEHPYPADEPSEQTLGDLTED